MNTVRHDAAGPGSRWRRRSWVAGAGVFVVLSAGCSSSQETTPVVVRSGVQGGQKWELLASKDATGDLCLELRLAGASSSETGGCRFDDSDSGGRELSWDADDGTRLLFGPVSTAAVKVRVTTPGEAAQETSTQLLPTDLAKGRLYVVSVPGSANATVIGVDATGAEVAPQDF